MTASEHTSLPLAQLFKLSPEWDISAYSTPSQEYLIVTDCPHLMAWAETAPVLATQMAQGETYPDCEDIYPSLWPVANDVIDHLLIVQALENLEEADRFLDEAVRVLKSKGVVTFLLPYQPSLIPLPARLKPSQASRGYSQTGLIQKLQEAGFDILQKRTAGIAAPVSTLRRTRPRLPRLWMHRSGWLCIRARKRLYAPIKPYYAGRKKRFSLGRILPVASQTCHGK